MHFLIDFNKLKTNNTNKTQIIPKDHSVIQSINNKEALYIDNEKLGIDRIKSASNAK